LREKVGVRGIFRAAFWLLLWLAAALPAGARAAEPPTATQPVPVSADELEQLVHTLQDDAARTKLVEQLRALIAVQRGPETEKPPAAALFGQLSQQIDAFSGEILAGVSMVLDAPRLFGWAREQISDIAARRLVCHAGRGSEPMIEVGSRISADALYISILLDYQPAATDVTIAKQSYGTRPRLSGSRRPRGSPRDERSRRFQESAA
jgi:hypothetical protein